MLKGVRSDVLANAAVHMQVGAEYESCEDSKIRYGTLRGSSKDLRIATNAPNIKMERAEIMPYLIT